MDRNIKRGVKLQNRIFDDRINKTFQDAFRWWTGGRIGKVTVAGFGVVFVINLYLVSAIFNKDLTPAFSSSAFLMSIAQRFHSLGILSVSNFFGLISMVSLSFAPISVYLFVRRVVHRHELTAFFAALLFIIPTPIVPDGVPLISALLSGDGAHVLVFCYLPLFLLYFRAFIGSGTLVWGVIAALGTAVIGIISPFSLFNLFIFYLTLVAAEGFKGGFRIKFARLLFVLVTSFGLSFFWYFPNIITQTVVLERISFALSFFWKVFPILIPTVPVFGAVLFLIFDRREKLSPVFIALFLNVSYIILYSISLSLRANGIFVPDRYIVEIAFAQSFLAALVIGFGINFFYQLGKDYLFNKLNSVLSILILFVTGLATGVLLIFVVLEIYNVQNDIFQKAFAVHHDIGIGTIGRAGLFDSPLAIFSDIVSIVTLFILFYVLKYFSAGIKEAKTS